MNEAHSTRARMALVLVLGTVVVEASACAPTHPIVANPTEPWEEELNEERELARESESNAPQPAVARQMYEADQEENKEPVHSPFVVAVTDIIGFPFRGAGWLAQQIF